MPTSIASAPRSPVFISANPASSDQSAKSAQGFGKAAITVLQIQAIDEQVVTLLAKAATEQAGEVNTTRPQAPGTPELRQADMPRLMRAAQQQNPGIPGQSQRLTPEAVMLMLAMRLSGVISDENSRSLASQLELAKSRLAAREATAAELSEAIRLAQALADAAMGDVGTAEGELNAAMEALKKAKAEVARLEQALADAPPEEQEAIRAQLEQAKAHAATQQGRVDAAQAKLNDALTTLNGALADLEKFKSQADQLDPNQSVSARGDEKALTNQAALGLLLARLQELIKKIEDEKMVKETEFTQQMLKAREAENLRRSQEYQEELEKAEQAKKKMGCIGKIVGWVVTVVAVVAAPFSGGASMAFAAVGLALAVGQELGFDPLGKILEPVMSLLMEAVKAMSSVIGSVLTAVGIPEDVVSKIKDVLAIVAVAAMVIAVAFVSKKLASTTAVQAITKAVTKAVTKAISDALPAILKAVGHTVRESVEEIAEKISQTMAKAVGSSADDLATWSGRAAKGAHTVQFGNQVAQGVGNVVIADMYRDLAVLKGEIDVGLVDTQILRDLIEKILQYFLQANNMLSDLFKHANQINLEQDQTAKFITQRVGSTAA